MIAQTLSIYSQMKYISNIHVLMTWDSQSAIIQILEWPWNVQYSYFQNKIINAT